MNQQNNMPVNVSPEYAHAEKAHLEAITLEDKIETLRKLISCAPAHKGGENLRAQLKTRLKSFLEKQEKKKATKKSSGKEGIKKEDMQAVIIGFSGAGKSTLISTLTKTPLSYEKSTPLVRMMHYQDTNVQLIDNPSIDKEEYDKGLTNGADTIIFVITEIEEIEKLKQKTNNFDGKRIVVFNKSDLLGENEKRKIAANLQSKKYNFVLFSSYTKENLEELKKKIFESFRIIRVYTKEPGKEKSKNPVILKPESIVEDVAEKISKGFAKRISETKIWGPSSKFPGQIVGMKHKLADGDVVEFKTR